jgi:hypothetical protein
MNAATAPLESAALPSGLDFADWLSPILVKELRQGLKSRVFTGSFIVMQVVMILTMGLRLLEQSERGTGGGGFDAFFWAMLWLPLLLLMPARGLGAVSEESRANTFDLVQLTRMTAFRIALGKWIALVAQTLLLVAALLPYAVLRYYFGGVDVVNDLMIIAHMIMVSMVLTAGAVALSAAPLAVRILALVIALPAMTTGLGGFAMLRMFGGAMGGFSFPSSIGGPGWWLLPCLTAIYVFMLLEFAAAKFGPPSENHPARKRTAALLLSVLLLTAARLGGRTWLEPLLVFFVPLIGWVLVEALTETTVLLPTIYAPFARRGFFARSVGRLLYPGWATAVPFTALVLGLTALAVETFFAPGAAPEPEPLDHRMVWPMMFFALVSPLPVMMIFPRVRQRFWLYVLIQLVFTLFFAAASIAADSPMGHDPGTFRWLAPFPTAVFLAVLNLPPDAASTAAFLARAGIGCGLALLAFLGFFIAREFRLIAQLERASLGRTSATGD